MVELISSRKRDGSEGELRIIEWITSHSDGQCKDFAYLLLKDRLLVRKLSKQHFYTEEFVRAVLERWLSRDNDDEEPCTWEALVQCAQDAGFDEEFVKLLRDNIPKGES